MSSTYRLFKKNVKSITDYYMLLVEETKSQRLVGSTNEWVLDNYYMISEQEKVLREELSSKSFRNIKPKRMASIETLLLGFLKKNHYEVNKALLFRYLCQLQVKQNDYLSYPEVCALLPLIKHILISELAGLCNTLRSENAYHYKPTDKNLADIEHLDHAAKHNLRMMNIFNSLKKMTKLPMAELIDSVSFSERALKAEKAGMYDQMQDKTKDDYRAQIVRQCKKKKIDEHAFVTNLLEESDAKNQHVGWLLFPEKRLRARAHLYITLITLATLALACAAAYALAGWQWSAIGIVLAILMVVPMSQIVIDLTNRILYHLHKPRGTFKLKFKDGMIPTEYATMVIMPTILKNKAKTIELLEQMEVYYLSNINRDGTHLNANGSELKTKNYNLFYTLIGDAAAYKEADAPWDEEVARAGEAKVKELNAKYGAPIFNFVYRRRAWSDGENCWLGHERKRGAILHFNDLLLGETSEEDRAKRFRTETISQWREGTVPDIRFIITLDTDTELVLYSAQKLIGSMAHPLNQAQLSPDGRRVDRGYGIMQPRVNVDVEVTNKSRYAQLFAGLGGLDVYTTASFELYQDIFDEGSFCGKGIYDLRVFQQVLKGTFPDNLILSHDLLEGCHIRCGLINDVELFDDNPSNYIDDAKRHHRWTRGDWQIIAWLRNRVKNQRGERVKNQVNAIGRWKIFDNLRRSVLSLSTVIMIFVGFGLNGTAGISSLGGFWTVLIALAAVASPIVFFILDQLTKLPSFGKRYHYYATLMRGFQVIVYRSLVQFALLPKEAWMYSDAAIRACYRMWFSHKDLLAWITSDEAAKSTKGTLGDYLAKFWFNYVCSILLAALVFFLLTPSTLVIIAAAFCIFSWCFAPFLMFWLGKKFPQSRATLNSNETEEIRQLARDTWNYFDTLLDKEHNWLIPDNYQIGREPLADYKTSPTNIGYSITSVICATELQFIDKTKALETLENIITSVEKLEKWNGHLFNWYGISSLKALPNFFISTADSGNFVACLYAAKGWLTSISDESLKDRKDALKARVTQLINDTDFSKLYNPELDVFSIGYDYSSMSLLPYHYNNFASEARLTSFLTISQGDAPYKHWFCLDKTLVQYHGYKGVASWYGTMFEYFMPLIFLPTYKHTLMDETYSFAIRAQRAFMRNSKLKTMPWGISETAYNELDDAQNYKYHAFGVPYLKFQNTTPDRIVISPYSSLLAISTNDRAVYNNLQRFKALGMYDNNQKVPFGLFESYDQEDHVPVRAHYAHHTGMILAALTNYLTNDGSSYAGGCLQRYFMQEPAMRSMETLLKEKAQVKPYIDLKITQYKRYQYSKVQTESDARDFDTIAAVPEIGFVSNGQYTVLMNDRGSGFSRYRDILMGRYRKISADHYGTYLYIRNLQSDRLWSATYAPLDVMPENYHVSFASDKLTYTRLDDSIETRTEVTVLKDRSAEIRRYTFTNNSATDVDLEITSYSEVVLCTAEEDVNHRVFNGMKILSEYDAQHQSLIFSRPGNHDTRHYLIHKLWVENNYPLDEETNTDKQAQQYLLQDSQLVEYETSRIKFLGRGNSLRHASVIESHRTLSGTVGTTLDPIMSMRRRIHIPAGKSTEAYIITGFAKAKEQLLQLADQYATSNDVEHAFKTSSVFNNMRHSMSLLKGAQMRLYCNMAKYMAQTATLGNERNELLAHNTLSQNGLWRWGISGDLAILLLEIDSAERSGFAKEMLRAFEYFKVHGFSLDLVIINSAPENEREGLYHFIRSMADTEHLWTTHSDAGKVYILNSNEISEQERTLLFTVARLTFDTHSRIEEQLQKLENDNTKYQDKVEHPPLRPKKDFRVWSDLEFYNQYGGFDNNGRDYVVTNTNTPMPWVNVIANMGSPDKSLAEGSGVFGFVVSSTMAGFTFAHNAQQFKLTGWSNDIVRDNASEMLLIDNKQFVPATARHGQGFSAFDADYDDGLHCDVRLFVAKDRMEKYYQIRLINNGEQERTIKLDMVYKLVLGINEEQTSRYLHSKWDEETQSILVRNVYHPIFRDTVVRLYAVDGEENMHTTRTSLNSPNRKSLGFDTVLPAGGNKEVAFVISSYKVGDNEAASRRVTMQELYRQFDAVTTFWDEQLSHIQVETPDRSFNHMVNRWYLYQVCSARLFARAGFYQVGGATGYRDQLQDVMSLLYNNPGYARRQILDHAAHQFAEGDVLHWWHESLKIGARTTFSDDYLWLPFVTYQYVHITGDKSILNEQVPFCKGEPLPAGENERCINYQNGDLEGGSEHATLYEHLRRSIARSMSRIGEHGLPLMGCGDWNDGMSRVGAGGKGESVWVAFFLCDLLPKMQQLTLMTPGADLSYCEELTSFRSRLVDALQKKAWDGNWFLRAYYDDGTPMGSRLSTECQIDLISQAWSILTDVATPEQKERVMRETDARLVNREQEIIQLLTPAFDGTRPSQHNPGYISNYPVGVRENGGQYTHGAMWYIMAQLKEGRRDMAYYLYSIINPIHRTNSLADVLKYKVEPYCMAADIYSNPQHPGRGGWTWYTGSASWAYKTGIEDILGLHKEGDTITFQPKIPSDWKGFTLRYQHGSSTYLFHVSASCRNSEPITLVDDGQEHTIEL